MGDPFLFELARKSQIALVEGVAQARFDVQPPRGAAPFERFGDAASRGRGRPFAERGLEPRPTFRKSRGDAGTPRAPRNHRASSRRSPCEPPSFRRAFSLAPRGEHVADPVRESIERFARLGKTPDVGCERADEDRAPVVRAGHELVVDRASSLGGEIAAPRFGRDGRTREAGVRAEKAVAIDPGPHTCGFARRLAEAVQEHEHGDACARRELSRTRTLARREMSAAPSSLRSSTSKRASSFAVAAPARRAKDDATMPPRPKKWRRPSSLPIVRV